ncbi:MAG: BamA/TamA family outer membrane protein, partial [Burkholderiaceae bacterium]|nr:BamA/TamA family outer membrane protein [Burkholderiaceae bacterium]
VLKANLARMQSLPNDFTLYASVDGQLSDQPLISNEQFVAGGVDSVRGYLDATAVGDKALRTSIELRTGNLVSESSTWWSQFTAHTFFDGAVLRLKDALPGQDAGDTLTSVGFGLRVQAHRFASVSLDVGWPLRDARQTSKGVPRLHASGVIEF